MVEAMCHWVNVRLHSLIYGNILLNIQEENKFTKKRLDLLPNNALKPGEFHLKS